MTVTRDNKIDRRITAKNNFKFFINELFDWLDKICKY